VVIQKQSNGWGDDDEEEFDDFKPTAVMPKLNSGAAVQINK
jgi:hypothetical protein